MTDTLTPAIPAARTPAPETARAVDLTKQPPPAPGPPPEPEDDGRPSRPVDPPGLPPPGVTTVRRRPIVAPWLKNRRDFLAAAQRCGGHVLYASLFHGLRVPAYTARLATMAPRGAARLVTSTGRWIWDREAAPLRGAAVRDEAISEYMLLARIRSHRVKLRGLVAVISATLGLAFALTLLVMAPGWLAAAAAAGVLALGYAGQQPDAPVIGPAVMKTELEKLTGSIVLRGLDSIGNAKISAAIKRGLGEDTGLKFVSEICRDGPGYRAEIDLPYGVTPEDVMEERQALASGLRRKMGCVWPSGDPDEHEGRMVLWVGDRPMNEAKKPEWPLLKSGQVDLFDPVVFGNDQRMRWMRVTLMFASVIIGSIPRMGKTFLMRLLLLICALDPRCELDMFDFKGTGDFRTLMPVAHRYRSGEEDEDVLYCLESLRERKAELRRRAKVINSLPHDICPESKVTSALAGDRSLGLHPIAIALDECQVAFEHDQYGEEIESICADLVKRGPALGMIVMFGTQRPDKKSLPTAISANAILRFALKVMGQIENDMILGTSMYKAGYRATMFSRGEKGICWMSGEGDDPSIVCGSFIDAPKAELVVARARKLREEYGNITGYAIGQQPETGEPEYDLLADILKVTGADEERIWNERIAARLNSLRPEVYGGWKGETVTAALKPTAVVVDQRWGIADDGEGRNRRGILRADVIAAVTKRDEKKAAA
ncbi:cell division protein FtsK [Streptomyces sp. NPDC018019]|uniref:cell division protein FtsK n=1 Tax=Streptomyces sp. NPDC018019 TaxID=3365030 RepID=UPI0037B3FA12